MVILSIDLGKYSSVCCWYTPGKEPVYAKMETSPDSLKEAMLREKVDRVVIEVCHLAGWIADLCQGLSLTLEVASTQDERWRWKRVKRKTDRIDALKLAKLSFDGELTLVHVPVRPVRQWRGLVIHRHRLVERQTQIKNSIRALFESQGHRLPAGAAQWKSRTFRELLKSYAMPLERCKTEQLWKGQLHGELVMLKTLVRQTAKVEAKLDQLAGTDEQIARLLSIPGIGLRTAEMVKVMLDDPKRFKHARQVGSYSGLTPRQYESGLMKRNGKISKAGPALLRKLLIQVAWGMLRNNARGKEMFNRICKGHKTRRKLAAVAVGRHALVWCWGVLKNNQNWNWKADNKQGIRAMAG